ncbi:hypothetical protein TomMM35A_32230 [Sphingobium sp. TomMM35A]
MSDGAAHLIAEQRSGKRADGRQSLLNAADRGGQGHVHDRTIAIQQADRREVAGGVRLISQHIYADERSGAGGTGDQLAAQIDADQCAIAGSGRAAGASGTGWTSWTGGASWASGA